jgi:hypothetical protein
VMKLAEYAKEDRQSRIDYVTDRWKGLAELKRDAGSTAATYLMVTNSGGAAAVLSYMGALKTSTPFVHAPAMLLAFVLGVILVGVGRGMAYYRVAARFDRWQHAVEMFYKGDWTWEQVLEHDAAMGHTYIPGDVVAWAAFLCFLTGAWLGLASLP